jgi:hypothetical protein
LASSTGSGGERAPRPARGGSRVAPASEFRRTQGRSATGMPDPDSRFQGPRFGVLVQAPSITCQRRRSNAQSQAPTEP